MRLEAGRVDPQESRAGQCAPAEVDPTLLHIQAATRPRGTESLPIGVRGEFLEVEEVDLRVVDRRSRIVAQLDHAVAHVRHRIQQDLLDAWIDVANIRREAVLRIEREEWQERALHDVVWIDGEPPRYVVRTPVEPPRFDELLLVAALQYAHEPRARNPIADDDGLLAVFDRLGPGRAPGEHELDLDAHRHAKTARNSKRDRRGHERHGGVHLAGLRNLEPLLVVDAGENVAAETVYAHQHAGLGVLDLDGESVGLDDRSEDDLRSQVAAESDREGLDPGVVTLFLHDEADPTGTGRAEQAMEVRERHEELAVFARADPRQCRGAQNRVTPLHRIEGAAFGSEVDGRPTDGCALEIRDRAARRSGCVERNNRCVLCRRRLLGGRLGHRPGHGHYTGEQIDRQESESHLFL